jgi:ABC-type dipeptide/oligopeptide/nickel transport system ATPase subunit
VLEGVLGELQHRTDGYLEQLADTMALELSATKPSAKAARGALASASAAASQSAASQADALDADSAVAADGATAGAKGRKAKPRAAKASKAADEREKEEISKVVKVQVGTQWLPRSLAQLSGGERRRVALALALGFADLVRSRGRLSCNVLVLDEVLQQLDGEGCTRVASLLRALPQDSVLVVGQAHSFVTQVRVAAGG